MSVLELVGLADVPLIRKAADIADKLIKDSDFFVCIFGTILCQRASLCFPGRKELEESEIKKIQAELKCKVVCEEPGTIAPIYMEYDTGRVLININPWWVAEMSNRAMDLTEQNRHLFILIINFLHELQNAATAHLFKMVGSAVSPADAALMDESSVEDSGHGMEDIFLGGQARHRRLRSMKRFQMERVVYVENEPDSPEEKWLSDSYISRLIVLLGNGDWKGVHKRFASEDEFFRPSRSSYSGTDFCSPSRNLQGKQASQATQQFRDHDASHHAVALSRGGELEDVIDGLVLFVPEMSDNPRFRT